MKNVFPSDLKLVKLPPAVELILFLIKEELKNRKFTNGLEQVGFDTSVCCTDFGILILSLAGFGKRTDQMYNWYYELLDKYAAKIEDVNADDIFEHALDFYIELMIEKHKRQVIS